MNYDYEQTEFSKAVLSGLFAGIAATLANLVYNFIFRGVTQYNPSALINVSSIIIISVLIITVAGVIFYFFHHYLKSGSAIFRLFFLALTIISVYYAMHTQRSTDALITKQFQELLSGVVIISGAFTVLFVPYLFNHEKIYS